MRISLAEPAFREVTIVLETQDELDQFIAIFSTVANNKIHHGVHVVQAAKDLHQTILKQVYPE